MKILLSWLYDHFTKIPSNLTIADIVTEFNKKTAEIEHVTPIVCAENLHVAKVTEIKERHIIAQNVVSGEEMLLPLHKRLNINQLYIVAKDQENYRFATMHDCGGSKELIMPQIFIDENKYDTIPELFSSQDTLIDIDNKSITHRPDLWSHRGIAREIAAIFNLTLKNIETLIDTKEIIANDTELTATEQNPFSITIEDTTDCKRFAGFYIDEITSKPTPLWMALRLARLDSKPIDALIDMTNYVLFDIGQPMHVFDADKLSKKRIIIRKADTGEIIETLDDEQTTLSEQDIVIADGLQPVSLAGIMGGKETAVNLEATSIFLESANFDATTIRRSAQRLKKRTESSMRFEKSLDPHQNITAIERYVRLLDDAGISYHAPGPIQSVGRLVSHTTIQISHSYIEKKLGITLASQKIIAILQALGFEIQKQDVESQAMYTITVPTFRVLKDIEITEDIIEEIGRFVGYETIPPVLPKLPLTAHSITATNRRREIKKLLSYAGLMRELYTYAFFDESFLQSINWSPRNYLEIKNPVSKNHTRLLTTLIPNLFKAVEENAEQNKQLRFYEWARIWNKEDEKVTEKKVISGLMYDHHDTVTFYTGKKLLQEMYTSIKINVTYESIETREFPWIHPYQSASIKHNGANIGTIGIITDEFVKKLTPGGSIFFFECDAEILLNYKEPVVTYKPSSKYPAIIRDISMTLPLSEQIQQIMTMLSDIDPRITKVILVDFFQKKEWLNKRAVTIRVTIQDKYKTLTSEDADKVCSQMYTMLQSCGAEIR